MTRYQYRLMRRVPGQTVYVVSAQGEDIGVVGMYWRGAWDGPRLWRARLHTDPLIEGRGRTRDAAVEDALNQVGGLG